MKTTLVFGLFALTVSVFAQYDPIESWDTITFNSDSEFIRIDTSSTNIWQIGIPQKSYFDTAYSFSKAILTDTTDSYPINNTSYFDLYIGEFNNQYYPYNIFISFKHKFDTDSLKDGGYITFSFDKGENWHNMIEWWGNNNFGQMTDSKNLYTQNQLLFNGEYGFSGNSNGWQTTMICWFVPPASLKNIVEDIGDTLMVRFNFVSDSIDNFREGWMIDDINLYSADLGGGAIYKTNVSKEIFIYPLPASNHINFYFVKTSKSIMIEILTLDGKKVFQNKYFNLQEVQVDTRDLTSGIYISKITLNNKEIFYNEILINK